MRALIPFLWFLDPCGKNAARTEIGDPRRGAIRRYIDTAFRSLRSAVRAEDGTATIEAVIWLPLFLAAFTLVLDTAVIMHKQSYIMRAVQDGNRAG